MIVLLYLGFAVLGAFVGAKLLPKNKEYKWIGTLQLISIMALVFCMGMRIGSDERVVESFASIGTVAFIITVLTLIGSILAVTILRKTLGFDKKGNRYHD